MEDKDKIKPSIEEQLEFYKLLVRQMPGHIYWKGIDGRYMGCNQIQALDTGFSKPEEVIGKTLYEIAGMTATRDELIKFVDHLVAEDNQIMASGKSAVLEECAYHQNGELATYLSEKAPLKDPSGKVIGMVGVTLDISSYKNLVYKLLREKNTLLGSIIETNDKLLRAPVGNIIGLAELLLLDEKLDPGVREKVEDIKKSATSIFPLFDRVSVYLGLISDEEEELLLEPENINSFIVGQLDAIVKSLPRSIEISFNQQQPISYRVNLDYQVFGELLSTLVRYVYNYSTDDVMRCALKADVRDDSRVTLNFSVFSNSRSLEGIDKKDVFNILNNVTDNYLVDQSLELSIVSILAKRLGGGINYEIQKSGTRFEISIVADLDNKTVDHEHYSIRVKNSDNDLSNLQKYKEFSNKAKGINPVKILLVEDDLISQRTLSAIFEMLVPVEMDVCGSCDEVDALIASKPGHVYDLVLLDLNLPDGSGAQVFAKHREYFGQSAVIVTTANTVERSSYKDSLFDDKSIKAFYKKPIRINDLCEILQIYVLDK